MRILALKNPAMRREFTVCREFTVPIRARGV